MVGKWWQMNGDSFHLYRCSWSLVFRSNRIRERINRWRLVATWQKACVGLPFSFGVDTFLFVFKSIMATPSWQIKLPVLICNFQGDAMFVLAYFSLRFRVNKTNEFTMFSTLMLTWINRRMQSSRALWTGSGVTALVAEPRTDFCYQVDFINRCSIIARVSSAHNPTVQQNDVWSKFTSAPKIKNFSFDNYYQFDLQKQRKNNFFKLKILTHLVK